MNKTLHGYTLNDEEKSIIDAIREGKTAQRRRKAMNEIAELTKANYFDNPQIDVMEPIQFALFRNGFHSPLLYVMMEQVCQTDNGRAIYDCNGCYLNVTWYKMSSGRWEIVAYVS